MASVLSSLPLLPRPVLGIRACWRVDFCGLSLNPQASFCSPHCAGAQPLAGASHPEGGKKEGRGAARPQRGRGHPWLLTRSLPHTQGAGGWPQQPGDLFLPVSLQVPLLSGFWLPYLTLRGQSPVLRGGLGTRLVNLSPGTGGHSSVLWHRWFRKTQGTGTS